MTKTPSAMNRPDRRPSERMPRPLKEILAGFKVPAEFTEKPCKRCRQTYSAGKGTQADKDGVCWGCFRSNERQ